MSAYDFELWANAGKPQEVHANIVLNDNTVISVRDGISYDVDYSSTSSDVIEIGSVVSAECNLYVDEDCPSYGIILANKDNIEHIFVEVYVHYEMYDPRNVSVPIGEFIFYDYGFTDNKLCITGYDRMYSLDTKLPDIQFPITADRLSKVIASVQGFRVNNGFTLECSDPIDKLPSWVETCRQALSWLSAREYKIAYFDNDGKLCFRFYYMTDVELYPDHRYSSFVSDQRISVSGVESGEQAIELLGYEYDENMNTVQTITGTRVNLNVSSVFPDGLDGFKIEYMYAVGGDYYCPSTLETISLPFIRPLMCYKYHPTESDDYVMCVVTHVAHSSNGKTIIEGCGSLASYNSNLSNSASSEVSSMMDEKIKDATTYRVLSGTSTYNGTDGHSGGIRIYDDLKFMIIRTIYNTTSAISGRTALHTIPMSIPTATALNATIYTSASGNISVNAFIGASGSITITPSKGNTIPVGTRIYVSGVVPL